MESVETDQDNVKDDLENVMDDLGNVTEEANLEIVQKKADLENVQVKADLQIKLAKVDLETMHMKKEVDHQDLILEDEPLHFNKIIEKEIQDNKENVEGRNSNHTEIESKNAVYEGSNFSEKLHIKLSKDNGITPQLEEGQLTEKLQIKNVSKQNARRGLDPMKRKGLNKKLTLSRKEVELKIVQQKNIICPECGQNVESKNHLRTSYLFKKHQEKHQVVNFSCDCLDVPSQVVWANQLRLGTEFFKKLRHMRIDHQGWFGCAKCRKCFSTNKKLTVHMETHSQEHKCDMCNRKFDQPNRLKDHIQIMHANPFKCPDCDTYLKSGRSFQIHRDKTHIKIECQRCLAMISKGYMNRHIRNHHNENTDKKFFCNVCEKGFMERIAFNAHTINVHIKSRPFGCRYGCEVKYNDTSNRNSHEKKKHGGLYIQKSNGPRDGQI